MCVWGEGHIHGGRGREEGLWAFGEGGNWERFYHGNVNEDMKMIFKKWRQTLGAIVFIFSLSL